MRCRGIKRKIAKNRVFSYSAGRARRPAVFKGPDIDMAVRRTRHARLMLHVFPVNRIRSAVRVQIRAAVHAWRAGRKVEILTGRVDKSRRRAGYRRPVVVYLAAVA